MKNILFLFFAVCLVACSDNDIGQDPQVSVPNTEDISLRGELSDSEIRDVAADILKEIEQLRDNPSSARTGETQTGDFYLLGLCHPDEEAWRALLDTGFSSRGGPVEYDYFSLQALGQRRFYVGMNSAGEPVRSEDTAFTLISHDNGASGRMTTPLNHIINFDGPDIRQKAIEYIYGNFILPQDYLFCSPSILELGNIEEYDDQVERSYPGYLYPRQGVDVVYSLNEDGSSVTLHMKDKARIDDAFIYFENKATGELTTLFDPSYHDNSWFLLVSKDLNGERQMSFNIPGSGSLEDYTIEMALIRTPFVNAEEQIYIPVEQGFRRVPPHPDRDLTPVELATAAIVARQSFTYQGYDFVYEHESGRGQGVYSNVDIGEFPSFSIEFSNEFLSDGVVEGSIYTEPDGSLHDFASLNELVSEDIPYVIANY